MRSATPAEAAEALRAGGVALLPTETVVGLISAESGLERLREIKSRDQSQPVALLCASPEDAFALGREAPEAARRLAELYWPGPLTLVLDAAGGGTIGVRVPEHPAAQALLAAYGGPLYATSANPSGEPAPAALEEVDRRITAAVDLAVEGKPGSGEASAVVDLSGDDIRLLRPTEELTEEKLSQLAENVPESLSPNARKVQEALHHLGYRFRVMELPESTRSAREAARAIGCEVGQIVKSLVFRVERTGGPVLVIASGPNRVDESKVGYLLGEPVEKPDAAFVREKTGFSIGGVPPLGHLEQPTVFVDEDLLRHGEVWAAAGTPNAVFVLSPEDLAGMTGGRVVTVK